MRSEKERATIQASITGGGGGGEITENLTANTVGGVYKEEQQGTYNIAAGAYKVRVRNSGISTNITVNGETVTPSQEWIAAAYENRNTGRTDFCPAVTIVVPAGGRVTYQTQTPSV